MFSKLYFISVLLISAVIAQKQQADYARLNIDDVQQNPSNAFWPRNQGFTPKPFEFETGKTYVYRYSSNVLNGMPKLADQYGSLMINADLILQCEEAGKVTMQMVNITTENRISKLINGVERRETPVSSDRQFEAILEKPVEFTHQKGQVTYLRAEKNEPQWSLNMKRAILSFFNLNLTPEKIIRSEQGHFDSQPIDFEKLTYFGVYEQAVTGICETSYEVKHNQYDSEHVLNITKNRNLENCLYDATYFNNHMYDISGCKRFCNNKNIEQITGYYPIPLRNGQLVKCPCTKERKINSIDQFSNVQYNVTLGGQVPVVESVYGHGRIALKVGGDKISSLTNVNLTLTRVNSEKIATQLNGQTVEYKGLVMTNENRGNDVPAMDFLSEPDSRELLVKTVEIFEQLADRLIVGDLNKQLDVTRLTGELQFQMAQFRKQSLQTLYQKIAERKTNRNPTVKDQIKRQLYLDILAIVGTNHAAQFITELVRSQKVSRHEALNLVDSVATNIYMPERETIDQYFNLCQALKTSKTDELPLYQATCLTAGKLVGEGCWYDKQSLDSSDNVDLVRQKLRDEQLKALKEKRNRIKREDNLKEQRLCKDADVERWVKLTYDNLVKSNDFHSKVTNLQTLVAMKHLKSLPYLVRYVNGKENNCPGYKLEDQRAEREECTFLRLVVVNGLKNFVPQFSQHIKALLLPVYFDSSEDYRVRIEALTVLMRTHLEKHELESIATVITRENNKQVISMSVSMIKELAQSTHPNNLNMVDSAKYVLSFLPKFEQRSEYSHAHWRVNKNNEKDSGIFWSTEMIASNHSRVPISFMFSFERFDSENNEKLISFDVHHKGIDGYLRRVFEPQGIISDVLVNKGTQREKRSVGDAKQAFVNLKNKLGLVSRYEDEVKAIVEMKIFDKVRTLSLDEETIKEWISKVSNDITRMIRQLKDGVDHHFVKVLMPTHSFFVVPNDLGMPTLVKRSEPLIISIKVRDAKLRLNNEKKLTWPTTFNASAFIEPTIYYTKYDSLQTITEGNNRKFGVHVPKSTYVRLPAKLSVSYDNKDKIVAVSVVPEMSQVLRHEVEPRVACQPLNSYYNKQTLVFKKTLTQLDKPYKFTRNYGHQLYGMGVKITTETENPHFESLRSRLMTREGILMALLNEHNQRHLDRVELTPDQGKPSSGFDFKFQYNWHDLDDCQDQCRDSNEPASERIVKRVRNHMAKALRQRYENDEAENSAMSSLYKEMFGTYNLKNRVENLINETSRHWQWTFEEQAQRINARSNKKTIRPTIINQVRLTAATKSIEPRAVELIAIYVHTQEKRVNLFDVELLVKTSQKNQYAHGRASMTYPGIPTEFNYEAANFENLKGIAHASVCWNEKCVENKTNIEINGLLKKTEERVLGDWLGKDELFNGYKSQCEIDRESGLTYSYACEKAIEMAAQFNSITLDIKHVDIPASLRNLTEKIEMALKVRLSRHMDWNGVQVSNEPGKVQIRAEFTEAFKGIPMMNLYIKRQNQETHFKKIITPVTVVPSAIKTLKEQYSKKRELNTCVHMEKAVRTFDNVTYLMPSSKCQHLLAMDCSARETFAVFVSEHNAQTNTKIVTVLVHGHEIKIMPPNSQDAVEVVLNNRLEMLNESEPRSYCVENRCVKIYVRLPYTSNVDPVTVIEVEKEDIKILTNGKSVKVMVGKRYKGKMCGLCGNNDDEVSAEYQGPNNCVYEKSQDFIGSYALTGVNCQRRPTPTGSFVCPAGFSRNGMQTTANYDSSEVTVTSTESSN